MIFTGFATLEDWPRAKIIVVHTDRDLCTRSQVLLSHCWRRKNDIICLSVRHWTSIASSELAVSFESGLTSSIVFVVWRELELSSYESWTSSSSWVGTKLWHANIGHSTWPQVLVTKRKYFQFTLIDVQTCQ